jgi:saccharopine dehydrogenase-like NADP-dependent oxidoreductase
MRILLVGAGGVGTAFARIAARRPFAELIVADYDLGRAQRAVAARDGYQAVQLDARDEQATAAVLAQHRCDVLMNATDPRFVMPLFRAALAAGTHYLDMAMSLSRPHPDDPYRQVGVELGELAELGVRDGANLEVAGSDPPSPWACDERTPS